MRIYAACKNLCQAVTMAKHGDVFKAGVILASIFCFEGFFDVLLLYPTPHRFFVWLGFLPGRHVAPLAGWLWAAVVTVMFVSFSMQLSAVRENIFRPSWLKLLAFGVAFAAGILEEVCFRQLLMDWTRAHDMNAWSQVLISSIAFGLAHGLWIVFRGSWRIGVGAVLVTGFLGGALALVYLASGRNLAPCVSAHFLINALIEPG